MLEDIRKKKLRALEEKNELRRNQQEQRKRERMDDVSEQDSEGSAPQLTDAKY